jgi:type IV secretion system protein VirB4
VAGLPLAYKAVQAGGQVHSVRNATVTLSRAAAMSLSARSTTGSATVPDLGDEEAQYVLETADGQPFWYSPYVGGRAFTIAVGPTRSGKTFFKNTLSAHFLKYGGFVRALDIDPGTETLAAAWGKDGGVVRLDAEAGGRRKGLNPFVAADAEEDSGFVAHLLDLGQALLAANDTVETQRLERHEQLTFDAAVKATLRLPPEMRSLEHLVAHLPRETQEKFARWVSGGAYDGIFNGVEDGIGALDTPLGVINLQAYRDDLRVLRPLFLDLFFRVSRLFEAAPHRALPKQLDIDEAHHPLAIAAFRAFLLKKVRTWAKHNASITLWTQSPGDYLAIEGWDAIRTAASTFIFLADGQMDDDLYKRAFRLTDGMCAAIRRLVPRREAFIVQPEAGIAKTVILEAEPEQRVINTSHPREAALRDRLIAQHGFDEGLKRAVAALAAE